MSQEDRVFWSYVHPKDRPESLGGGEQQEESMEVNEGWENDDEVEVESGESDKPSSDDEMKRSIQKQTAEKRS